jgi:hypothetical protein
MSPAQGTSPYQQFGLPLRVVASRTMYWLNAAGAVVLAILWRLQRSPEGYDPAGEDWSGVADLLGVICNVMLGMVMSSAIGYAVLAVIATVIAAMLVRVVLW